jgi:hypothetical protein
MTGRRLTLCVLLYVTLDLSSPFVPGAFTFDLDDCVEGVHSGASTYARRAAAAALPARKPVARPELSPRSPGPPRPEGRHPVIAWLTDTREDRRAATAPPPPAEDH